MIEENTKNVVDIKVENPTGESGKSGSCKSIIFEILAKFIKHSERELVVKILSGLDEDKFGIKGAIGSGYQCPVAGIGPGKRSCVDRVVKAILDSKEYEKYKQNIKDAVKVDKHDDREIPKHQ
jgi:hypothetical protein